tara:strand:- start:5387 stop:5560 length:174 start_codon:yes stop_codon:yes gene_type:complete
MRKIKIEYVAEIPSKNFDKFCKTTKLGIRDATFHIKEAAIKAAEQEINHLVNVTVKF